MNVRRLTPTLQWSTLVWFALAAAFHPALPASAASPSDTTALRASGRGGAVASAAPDATAAGVSVLRAGGNAADAAVATALALAVVHPIAGNLGGGGFAVSRFDGLVTALDFRETAPRAATRHMFLGPDGRAVPEKSLVGPLASGVPGSPQGLWELHRRHGRLPWRRVVLPAIHLAQRGFRVTPRLQAELESRRDLLSRFPETSAVWLPRGQVPQAGTLIRLRKLASWLQRYAEKGPSALTSGRAAHAVAKASLRHGGVITAADMSSYRPVWREPVRFEAFGWSLASMPLPSSGGVILGQTLGVLERLEWAESPAASAQRSHLFVETWRRAFSDRTLMGDPETTQATERQLLGDAWLDRRAGEIDAVRATASSEVRPFPVGVGHESPETTHLSVIDADGNAVALTTTLNGAFGCGLLVPELQILLNNEMDDFTTAPGSPNMFGLIQGEANAVGPGKRMLSSMTPTIAWREGDVLVVGSPGGSRIPTSVAQVFLRVAVDGMAPADAVAAPRLHHQWQPDEVQAERGALPAQTAADMEQRGHRVKLVKEMGEVAVVERLEGGRCEAAADPRGPGAAAVVTPGR
ncbi:MAG: gamma-glutamyltransferase [Acidobacteriota bacterium]